MKDRIKQVRKELKLTQAEFGQRIGLTRDGIAAYERGIANPTQSAIMMILKEFNVNEEWLRTGNGDMFRAITEQEQLATWFADLSKQPVTSAQRRVFNMLMLLDPSDWITIDKMIRALADQQHQEDQQ